MQEASAGPPPKISTLQAAFLGVGAMVGAGIFALLGQAGVTAGSATWLAFLLGGCVAILQGYSFAMHRKYPVPSPDDGV